MSQKIRTDKVSAGSYDLNKFLHGGYETDIITTVYGPGGSGKSNIVMSACVSQAKKGNKIIFIDTEGSFSVERFVQIHGGSPEQIKEDFSNVLVMNPTSFEEQEIAFENMLLWVKKKDISLIIIDSLVMLYRLELGDAIKTQEPEAIGNVNRKLANQLRSLNEIARKQQIPVIVTNQVYTSFTRDEVDASLAREINMVGGDLLKYWSKCLLEVEHSFGKRKLKIKKHRSLPENEMPFEIIQSGIRKKGFF